MDPLLRKQRAYWMDVFLERERKHAKDQGTTLIVRGIRLAAFRESKRLDVWRGWHTASGSTFRFVCRRGTLNQAIRARNEAEAANGGFTDLQQGSQS